MLKYYIKASEALKDFRKDQAGVVSFEYVIVAACIVIAVTAVFGSTGATSIQGKLQAALSAIDLSGGGTTQ